MPVATAMQKLPPVPFLAGRTFWLKTGQTLDIGRLKTDLVDAGYNHVSHVVAAGEFAVRGGIVDLFPMGSEMPYRIDLFDDEIDSIKTFDTDTQRTISPVSEIRLLPAHEFPTDSEAPKDFPQPLPRGSRWQSERCRRVQSRQQRPFRRGRGILSAAVF